MTTKQILAISVGLVGLAVALILILPFGEFVRYFLIQLALGIGTWSIFLFQIALAYVGPIIGGHFFRSRLLNVLDEKFVPYRDLNFFTRFAFILLASIVFALLATTVVYYSAMFDGTLFSGFSSAFLGYRGRWETFPTGIFVWGLITAAIGSYIGTFWNSLAGY